jgi:hypothetical protein
MADSGDLYFGCRRRYVHAVVLLLEAELTSAEDLDMMVLLAMANFIWVHSRSLAASSCSDRRKVLPKMTRYSNKGQPTIVYRSKKL